MFIKRVITENPILYRFYFHLYRKHRGLKPDFFTNQTELYFDGYPRSGNTFLSSLIHYCFENIHAVDHLHRVAPIKIALSKSIPAYILIRDPFESISSNYIKLFSLDKKPPEVVDMALLKRLTDYYVSYYTYVNIVRNRVQIIQFEELIQDPVSLMKDMRNTLNWSVDDLKLEKSVNDAISNYKGATDKYGSSRPNVHKEREKDKIKDSFQNVKSILRASELFEKFQE